MKIAEEKSRMTKVDSRRMQETYSHSRKEVRLQIQIHNWLMSCRAIKTKLSRLSFSPDKSFATCLFSTCGHLLLQNVCLMSSKEEVRPLCVSGERQMTFR